MSEDASKLSSVNNIIYEGRDLESMSFALNYHRWILSYLIRTSVAES
jgi:hypothetical protein